MDTACEYSGPLSRPPVVCTMRSATTAGLSAPGMVMSIPLLARASISCLAMRAPPMAERCITTSGGHALSSSSKYRKIATMAVRSVSACCGLKVPPDAMWGNWETVVCAGCDATAGSPSVCAPHICVHGAPSCVPQNMECNHLPHIEAA